MSTQKGITQQTKKDYTRIWNRIQAVNLKLSDIPNMTYQEFYKAIGSKAKTKGLYNLAISLGRHIDRQKDVNAILTTKAIPTYITKPITEKQHIPISVKKVKIKPLNVQLAKTKFHIYKSDRLISGSPVNFKEKYVIIYRFKQNRIGKEGFESKISTMNNFFQLDTIINIDLSVLNRFFQSYYNSKVIAYSFGFIMDFELYNPKTLDYKDNNQIGQKTQISSSETKIQAEQLSKLYILDKRFEYINKKASSLLYFIYNSRIMITFYVPLKQSFTF